MTGQSGEAGARTTILVVEDDGDVLELIRRALEPIGSRLLLAGSAIEAAAVADGVHLDLLLTDVVLPGASGTELALQLRVEHPALRVIYMTGWPEHIALADIPETAILRKPFDLSELAGAVESTLSINP